MNHSELSAELTDERDGAVIGGNTWKDKSGATSASYTVTAKASYNGIQYRCVVKNSIGSVTSEEAKLTVK